ncbi:MAG: ABC transporter ATP-binding protein [Candidatus Paceibacterota bacterium]
MALIEVRDLKKEYDDGTKALRGVSFDVEDGEFVAIMGPSGSGKSTMLHLLGLLDPMSGGVYKLEGKNVNEFSDYEIAKIRNKKFGFVFQMFNLLPTVSVFENVKLPLFYSDVKRSEWDKIVTDTIEKVGLTHRKDAMTMHLSGGEKQRVAIARALINNPQVIFADEPTGNLDSKSGESIINILQKLNDNEKHTIILITHETGTARHAKRIINILDGEIASDKIIPVSERLLAGGNHTIK